MSADAEALDDVEFPLGEYRVLQLLGRGGIGEVFVAHRRGHDALCALKRLRPDVQAIHAAHARIRREAHLATYLDHPNICRVLDAGVEEGCFFLATELVPGVDLERLIGALAKRRLALAMDMVQAIMLPALAGLAHAHAATDGEGRPLGVVHRDLSPRNIMVTFDGQVKIIDFGVARAHVDDYRTAPGVLVGTLKFLSPEQALGTPLDARSDLYSLGAVMYEMLTGRSVVVGSKGLVEVLQEIVGAEPKPVTDFNPAVTPEVMAVLERALAKRREERFVDAAQMAEALRAAGGPPAPPAELGRLVRSFFGDLVTRFEALAERAKEISTPPPRPRSRVDQFASTSVGPGLEEAYAPTRAGRPDEAPDEPPIEPTRAAAWTQLRALEHDGQAILPTRLLDGPGLEAPASPMTEVVSTTLAPPPSSTSSHITPPAPRRGWIGLALLIVAAATLGAAVLVERSSRVVEAPVQVTAGEAERGPVPTPRAGPIATPKAPEAEREVEAREAAVKRRRSARRRAPSRAARPDAPTKPPPRDRLQTRLTSMANRVSRGATLDPAALTELLDEVEVRAARTSDASALARVRAARDCLATCPTQEKMVARARAALRAVLEAEAR